MTRGNRRSPPRAAHESARAYPANEVEIPDYPPENRHPLRRKALSEQPVFRPDPQSDAEGGMTPGGKPNRTGILSY